MFKGAGLKALVGTLIVVSTLIIFLEWRAVRGLPKDSEDHSADLGNADAAAGEKTADGGFLSKREMVHLLPFPAPPEVRHRTCQNAAYPIKTLPKITMVIPYLNETW